MLRALWVTSILALGCRGQASAPDAGAAPSSSAELYAPSDDEEPDAGGAQQKGEAKQAGERVSIPAGGFVAGSTPGDRGRDPSLEPALVQVELDAFDIDKLPYPNDPARPPRTGVSRDQAAKLCAERSGRLCTELEWERACKGPGGTAYAGGRRFAEECRAEPRSCASGFGVLALGGALREWTASTVEPIKQYRAAAGAAVRGAPREAADVDHRCARRDSIDATATAGDLGFRCCYGQPDADVIRSPQWETTVRKIDVSVERLEKLFASDRRLGLVSREVKLFREESAEKTVRARGKARGVDGGAPPPPNTYLTASPILWNPVPGEEVVVVTGQAAGKHSFIVALHRLPGDRYRLASSLVMRDEPGPVVLVYNPYVRRKLHWATCWECYAETGSVTYRDDHRVVITHE